MARKANFKLLKQVTATVGDEERAVLLPVDLGDAKIESTQDAINHIKAQAGKIEGRIFIVDHKDTVLAEVKSQVSVEKVDQPKPAEEPPPANEQPPAEETPPAEEESPAEESPAEE